MKAYFENQSFSSDIKTHHGMWFPLYKVHEYLFNKCVKWHSKLHNFFASHVDHLSHIVKNFFLLVFAKLWQKTLKSFFSATSPSQNCCKQFYLANVYGSGFSKPTNVNQRLLTIDTVFVMLVWDKSNQIWQTKTFQEPSMTMIVVL